MGCPSGQHQHLTSKGKMSTCHPISTKHQNEKTQQYHLMALQQAKGGRGGYGSDDEDFGREEQDKSIFTPEQKQKFEQNKKLIRNALNKLTRGRFKALFVPLTGILVAYDGMGKKITQLKERAKSKKEKAMADAYAKAVEEFIDLVPTDDSEWGSETLKRVSENVKDKAESLREVIKVKGKDCPEYAQYRAYKDFCELCDSKTGAVYDSVSRRRMKANPKEKLPYSKEDILKKVELSKNFRSKKLPQGREKTDNLQEWEEIQARNRAREKIKEKRKLDEVSGMRTSNPYHPSGKSRKR